MEHKTRQENDSDPTPVSNGTFIKVLGGVVTGVMIAGVVGIWSLSNRFSAHEERLGQLERSQQFQDKKFDQIDMLGTRKMQAIEDRLLRSIDDNKDTLRRVEELRTAIFDLKTPLSLMVAGQQRQLDEVVANMRLQAANLTTLNIKVDTITVLVKKPIPERDDAATQYKLQSEAPPP